MHGSSPRTTGVPGVGVGIKGSGTLRDWVGLERSLQGFWYPYQEGQGGLQTDR